MRGPRFLPVFIRRGILQRKRRIRQADRFEKAAAELEELAGQYHEWMQKWITRREETAHTRAKNLLDEMYGIIKRRARAHHKPKLRALAMDLGIPGVAPYLNSTPRASRRR